MKKKEPFSLLCSQVKIYDPTQQKFKLQQCQPLKLIGPVGLMHAESAGHLYDFLEEDVLSANSQCVGHPPPPWCLAMSLHCVQKVFTEYLLRA